MTDDRNARIEKATDFLTRFPNGAEVNLVAICEGSGPIARTFSKKNTAAIAAFIGQHEGRANLYHHPNPLKPTCRDRKAKKEDVDAVCCLFVDIDSLDRLERIKSFSPTPSLVVMSGGGYNCYWFLAEATRDFALVERIQKGLVVALDGDRAATDISRILRIPFTTNIPTRTKRERGRTEVVSEVIYV